MIETHSLRDTDAIPNGTYTMYVYSSGIAERFRAVFSEAT
jgi:hypothetical protein